MKSNASNEIERTALERLQLAATVNGAPEAAAAMVAAAVATVVAALPTGAARPPFGAEPADFIAALREARR